MGEGLGLGVTEGALEGVADGEGVGLDSQGFRVTTITENAVIIAAIIAPLRCILDPLII